MTSLTPRSGSGKAYSTSSSLSVAPAPPPIPPRSCDINETYMDDLCKRVTDHALDGKGLMIGNHITRMNNVFMYTHIHIPDLSDS